MSIGLLLLSLVIASPAQAQSGYPGSGGGYPGGGGTPPPDPGHYWQITYANSNPVNKHFVRDDPAAGQITPTQSGGGSTIIDGDDECTVTTTLTWIPAAGKTLATDPPAEPVHMVEFSDAAYGSAWGGPGPQPDPSGTADDGLGDPAGPGLLGTESKGTHLIHRDGSSGTIVLDAVTLKAINPASTWTSYSNNPGYHYWDWTGGYNTIMFNVSVDTSFNPRSVTITSSIDPTYHKDTMTGQRIPNQPTSDGTVNADSANLWDTQPGPSIIYFGHPTGSWDPNSSYHWYSAVTAQSEAGTFAPSPFSVAYPPFITTREHINLHCIDASDGANATANYYVNWHNVWEGLMLDAANTEVIDRNTKVTLPDGTDYPAQENHSTQQSMPMGTLTLTATATAALSAQFNGSFKMDDFLTLGGNFQPTLSVSIQAGQAVSGPPIPPLTYSQLYFHLHYHRNHWLTDHYNSSGFDQTYTQIVDGDEKYISFYWGQAQTLGNVGGP